MKKVKRILSLFLAALLAVSLAACGGQAAASGSTAGDASETKGDTSAAAGGEYDKVVYAFVSFNNIPDDVTRIEEAINAITREKIGVEVDLQPMSVANYDQQVSLAMQGGEQIDVIHTLGNFSQYLSKDQAYDITDIIDSCAPEAKEIVGERFMAATTRDGRVYGLPANKSMAIIPQFIYRKDVADELGLDFSGVKSVYDLEPILAQVKEGRPDLTPLATINVGDTGVLVSLPEVDYLCDDFYYPKGVLIGDSTTVEDLYASDLFKEHIGLMRRWNEAGYISKDAATTTSIATELITAGTAFAFMGGYAYEPEDTAVAIAHQTGQEIAVVNIGEPYMDTSAVNSITWMVASTSKNPEAALKFLNLTYSDPEVLNHIIFGIEDEDYVKVDENTVRYPDGLDAATVPYTAQLSCGIVGNQFLQYVMEGTDQNALQRQMEMNQTAKTSSAFGFIFDNSPVKTEYTSVLNVINEYLPGLRCGTLDPETELPKFIDKLNEAGLDRIIAEKQTQLDAWQSQNS